MSLLYLATAKLGFLLAIPPGNVTAVWPPSGIALAALLLWGRGVWPGIWLGAFLANTWVFKGAAVGPMDLALGAIIGGGSALQALAGVWLLRRRPGGGDVFDKATQVFWFVLVALAMCLISSTIGVTSLAVAGLADWAGWNGTWLTWWLGDVAGVLMVTPLLLAWGRPATTGHAGRPAEAALLLAALAVTGALALGLGIDARRYPLGFLVFPGLVWAAIRFNERVVTVAIVGLAGLAIGRTSQGAGPFALAGVNESLLLLQAYAGVITLGTLVTFAALNERRKADVSLRASEDRWRLMNAVQSDCVKLLGPDGSLLQMNPAGLRMIEADSFDQVAGQCIYPNIAAEHRASFEELTGRVFRGESGTLEFQFTGLRGAPLWLETHAAPMRDEQGRVVSLLGITRDITGRKRAEEELRQSREQFQMLFQSSPLATSLFSPGSGKLVDVNARFVELLGFSRTEVLGRSSLELGLWCDLAARDQLMEIVLRDRQVRNFEARLRTQQGQEFDALLNAQLVALGSGPVVMVQALDLTERKRAEAALKAKDELLRRVIDLAPIFIFAKDRQSRFLFANRAAAEALGLSPEELVGRNDLDLGRAPTEAEAFMRDDREVIASGQPKLVPEETLTDSAGRVRVHQTIKIPFQDPGTGEPALLGVAVDITERKRAELTPTTSHARALRQRSAITSLAFDPEMNSGDLRRALQRLTEELAAALQVERASVWLNSPDGQELRCINLFEAGAGKHSEGAVIPAALCPRYWHAFQTETRIDADDAVTDPRTSEFAESYLIPLGITSMLDAVIQMEGRPAGVVCLEHTGAPRHWETDEESFANTAAALVAQILANTERKRAEAALEMMRFSVDHAGDSVFWVSRGGRILYANSAACAGRGHSREELLSLSIFDLDPDYQPGIWEAHFEELKRCGTLTLETRHRAKDGRVFPVEVNGSYVQLGGQEFNFASVRDISGRRRMEASLRLTQFSMDRAADSVFWVAPDGEILYVNEAACRTLGYAREEMVGRNVTDIDPNFPAAAWPAHWAEVKQRKSFTFESNHQTKEGRSLRAEITVNYLEFEGREYNCVLLRDVTGRQQAAAALHASDALKAAIFESALDALITIDREGTVVEWNAAAERIFGHRQAEAVGRDMAELIIPARLRAGHRRGLAHLLASGEGPALRKLLELPALHADGTEFPAELFITPIRSQPPLFTGFVRNISARKRAEERLVAFAELGRRLSAAETPRAASEIIVELAERLIGWDSCVVHLYSAVDDSRSILLCQDIVNGRRCDVDGSSADRFLTPRARRVLAHGGELELREDPVAMPPDTAPFGDVSRPSRSLMTVPVRDRDRAIGLLSIQSYQLGAYTPQDLELLQALADHCGGAFHRLQAEEAVRASEARLREAQRIVHLGSWEWDLTNDQLFWSDEIFRLLELEVNRSRPFYQTYRQLIHPEDREAVDYAYAVAGKDRQPYEITFRLLMPDGRIKWVQEQGEFDYSEAGVPLNSRGTLQDITERRELEEHLRQAQKMEAIGQLAGGIAHDFNNILGAILGNVQLGQLDTTPDHPARESLDEIRKGCTRAKDLVQQILAFSRQQAPERQALALGPILAETVKLLRATIPAGVELVSTLGADVPPVLADATQMHQILMNLGTNAWHALGDRPGRIEFRLRTVELGTNSTPLPAGLRPGRFVTLAVSDTGHGIDEATRQRLFDPFFTTKEPGKGTGLGLSVVHGIVQAHEGAITVTSELGQGTTFEVFLPVAAVPAEDEIALLAGPPAGGSRRILVLDDEAGLVRLARRLLGHAGHQVTGFTLAAEALAAFRADPDQFDLVITDYNMPGMSGLAVAAEFQKVRPEIPILLNSGHVTNELRQRAQAASIREVLLKPNTLEELAAAIHRHAPETSPRQGA